MPETISLGEVEIALVRKQVKHVHLTVHPPTGRVTLVAPYGTRTEVARAYAISKLTWIRKQRRRLAEQLRQSPRQFVPRESHYVWGRRYLLEVVESDAKPAVKLGHRSIRLSLRPGADSARREAVMHDWYKALLHEALPPLIAVWEARLGVHVHGYFLQRMKTRWGSCNHSAGTIRLNTELVKKPRDLLEYVVVHEMLHLIESSHSERFLSLLDKHYPAWREARAELNALPLSSSMWRE
jgi:predicted metal-dependent hydrolase